MTGIHPRYLRSLRPAAGVLAAVGVLLLSVFGLIVGAPGARGAEPGWVWPVGDRAAVVRLFEAPEHPYGPGHRGIDIAADPGAAIRAAHNGTVAFSGVVAGKPVVSIDHPGGLRSTYEPVVGVVAAGDPVSAGEVIGALQAGHRSDQVALHFGIRQGKDTYLDPLRFLGGIKVRLYPLAGPAGGVAGTTAERPAGPADAVSKGTQSTTGSDVPDTTTGSSERTGPSALETAARIGAGGAAFTLAALAAGLASRRHR